MLEINLGEFVRLCRQFQVLETSSRDALDRCLEQTQQPAHPMDDRPVPLDPGRIGAWFFQKYSLLFPGLSAVETCLRDAAAGAKQSVTSRNDIPPISLNRGGSARIQPAVFPRQPLRRHAGSGWRLPGPWRRDARR